MKPDKYQEIALKTWYAKDDPRHNDKMPALLGLVGEAGEIAELVKKAKYKYEIPVSRDSMLEELGDYWWYLRVVAYLYGITIHKNIYYNASLAGYTIEKICLELSIYSIKLCSLKSDTDKYYIEQAVLMCMYAIASILFLFDCTLDELTKMNYAKLSGGKHGWEEH